MVDLGFLSIDRKEREVVNGVLVLLDTVTKTVDSFVASVHAWGQGDTKSAADLVENVFESETKADRIHREVSLKIAEGAFFGGVREDILELLEKIDNIADSAKDAARFISSDSRLRLEAKDMLDSPEMKKFLGALRASVTALTTLVEALEHGKNEALSKVHIVEEFEEEADSHKDAFLKILFSQDDAMNPVTVIQLRDFVFVADDVADNAEDASDVILVLIAKGYG